MNLGWKVKYHTHSPSRELSGKSSVKVEKKKKKKKKKPYFEALLAHIFEQKRLLCRIMLCQLLNEKMSLHEKNRKSSGPKKNVKLIQGRSEEQSNNNDFIRHSVYRGMLKKVDHISCLLDILFIYHFELILHVPPHHAQPN